MPVRCITAGFPATPALVYGELYSHLDFISLLLDKIHDPSVAMDNDLGKGEVVNGPFLDIFNVREKELIKVVRGEPFQTVTNYNDDMIDTSRN